MSTNCERRRDFGAVQLAEATLFIFDERSKLLCALRATEYEPEPGIPVRAMSYSRIARPQLGHAGVLPTGCSDDLNRLNWGIAPLLTLPTNSPPRTFTSRRSSYSAYARAVVARRRRSKRKFSRQAKSVTSLPRLILARSPACTARP